MALIDRVKKLDKQETFEEIVETIAAHEYENIVRYFENKIKTKNYTICNEKKHIEEHVFDILYNDENTGKTYSKPDYYYSDGDRMYFVNDKYEAEFLINTLALKLKKEGITTNTNLKTTRYYEGTGFFKKTHYQYRYSFSCVFEWQD